MANGQEENNTETKNEPVTCEEVKDDKPAENVKNDTKTEEKKELSEPSTELLEQVKDQIEFYFGDVNMQRDKFLTEQIKLDEGWIPLSVMLNFNMLASMTTDHEVIVKALEPSELIEVSEDKKKIRRSPKFPLPVYNEEYRKAQEAKTVYLKGFPLQDTNIKKLKAFFDQYEPYENIVMRKYPDKEKVLHFKGSIFVQFKTLENAKAFMSRESVKYNDTELIRKWSADYAVEQANEKEERKRIQEARNKKKDTQKNENKEIENVDLPKGAIIHMEKMPDGCTREIIRSHFEKFQGTIAYIDFDFGDKEAWIRFQEENAAKTILDELTDNKIKINETEITCRVLENEEEEKYLVEVKKCISNTRQRNKSKNDHRKNRSGHKGGRKRLASSAVDKPPAKIAAAE